MRVLYVTNPMPPTGCGVAQFGRLQSQALIGAGVAVTVWEAAYPTYLPENAADYDVIHLNFHPITLGHIQAQHLPWPYSSAQKCPLISAHFHEYDPKWEDGAQAPDLWNSPEVKLKFSSEINTGKIYYPIPIPDYEADDWVTPELDTPIRIGYTGLRRDGLDWIKPVCDRNGWTLDINTEWLSMEKEIDRLAMCHINVVHMHGGYSGQSSAVCTAIAALQPTLINSNRMLTAIWDINEQFGGKEIYRDDDLERGIKDILLDYQQDCHRIPYRIKMEYGWRNRTRELIHTWKENL